MSEVRLIDANALKEVIFSKSGGMEDLWDTAGVLNAINNAPTVSEITKEKLAIAYEQGYEDGKNNWLQEGRPQGEWVPVSERLPEEMQTVLIWFEYFRYGEFNRMYQTYGFGYVYGGKFSSFINGESGWDKACVIAWQPLPEPYKRGGAE